MIIVLKVSDDAVRKMWIDIITSQIKFNNPAAPQEVEYITSKSSYGYLIKQGQKNKLSWKRRFFAVKNGIMTYYERETFLNSHIGVNELGKINLNDYTISSNGDIIKLTKLNERELGYIII